jgi:O-methyltransferase
MSALTRLYRRTMVYASTPMFVESVARSNRRRDRPVPKAAIWKMAPRFMWNGRRIETASVYAEHLAIAAHIIGMPASTEGCVIECGCYKGGSTANLSLAAALVDRELHVFDSFEGLPEPRNGDGEHVLHLDRKTNTYEAGMYAGSLDQVRANVARMGDIRVCRFHKGWFDHTLPGFAMACVTAFVDVDLRSSLETCVRVIWPLLVDGGALFVHEARHQEIASLFFDQGWWQENLGVGAPGLVGAGTGLGLDPEIGGWTSQLGYAIKTQAGHYVAARG